MSEDEELQALLDDDPTQKNTIINNDKFKSCIDGKTTRKCQDTWQSCFVTRQCPLSHIKTGERHPEITWMGHPPAPAIII